MLVTAPFVRNNSIKRRYMTRLLHCIGVCFLHLFSSLCATMLPRFFQYLIPNVVCIKVTRPETKTIVLSTSLMASVLFAKHIGPLRM